MNTVQEEKTMAAIPVLPSLRSLRSPLADLFRRIRSTTAQTIQTIRPVASAKLIRAAGYARVSTNSEDQKSSIEIQKQHFASIAAVHDDWEFTGIYYDIVSGTKAEKRPQLQQLLSDCKAGRVNLVLTKSVSRFARNTADLLSMVRSLTALGVDIIFDREHLDTRTMGSEFLLTVLASLAEDESHSISANCRWGIQERFRDGSYRAASAPYGYDLVDGTYVVNEEEAEIVKEIFNRTLAGEGICKIAEGLNKRGVPTKRAGQVWKGQKVSGKWTYNSIYTLLQNEAYVGDMILQKTYSDDTFQRVRNDGAYPQYHLKGHHEGIIDSDTFGKVREIREQKSIEL